jgi:hypothetical protein
MPRPKTEGELPLPKHTYESCPFCHANKTVKAGFYRKPGKPERQRYYCPSCRRYTVNPLPQLSLKTPQQWPAERNQHEKAAAAP